MKNHVLQTFTVLTLAVGTFFTSIAFCEISISDTEIPYLAMAKGNSERNFIVSNPTLCKEVPGPCRFFIKHVQAHRQLNHLILPPNSYPALTETKADCFAAKNGNSQDVLDTHELLMQPDEAAKYSILGNLKTRAENIRSCAIKAKNWVGKL